MPARAFRRPPLRRRSVASGGQSARFAARGCLAVVLALALAACTTAGRAPAPSPTAAVASSPAPTSDGADQAEAARTAGVAVPSGAVTLLVAALAEPVGAEPKDDGSVVLTVPVDAGTWAGTGAASRRVAAAVVAPSGLRFEARPDRSIAVVASTGAVVGALSPLAVVYGSGAGMPRGAGLAVQADDSVLDVVVDPGAAGTATLTFGATPLVSADWGEREGGRSLAVVPAAWVRVGSLAAQDALWSAVVAVAPDADSATMHDQLTCHALGAADKAAWNLEPWRPQVDSIALLAARCNP